MDARELQWCIRAAEVHEWPYAVFEAAYQSFGARIFNSQGRAFRALHRRVRHALVVWDDKYGPLNASQELYAEKVLAKAILNAASRATSTAQLFPFTQAALARMVNHDRVHAGFRRRADEATWVVALDDLLKEVPR